MTGRCSLLLTSKNSFSLSSIAWTLTLMLCSTRVSRLLDYLQDSTHISRLSSLVHTVTSGLWHFVSVCCRGAGVHDPCRQFQQEWLCEHPALGKVHHCKCASHFTWKCDDSKARQSNACISTWSLKVMCLALRHRPCRVIFKLSLNFRVRTFKLDVRHCQ